MNRLLSCEPSRILPSRSGAGADPGDPQHGLVLAMTVLAPVVVPPLLLEDDDLVGATMLDELGADRGAGDERRAGRGAGALTDHQNLAKPDRRAGLADELLDRDHIAFRDLILFAAGADHCEHLGPPCGELAELPRI